MICLKCGKETEENQVFCGECRQVMAQYPVKPGTPIQLPQRKNLQEKKTVHKKKQNLEKQIAYLQNTLRRLYFVVALLLLTVAALLFFLLK